MPFAEWSLKQAPSKRRYLVTWGWVDLISSIPAIDVFRWGRTARVLRVLRVLRGVRSARELVHFLARRRVESAALATVLLSLLLVVCSSIAVIELEIPAGGNITTAEDAMWWAVATTTTVGYGERSTA